MKWNSSQEMGRDCKRYLQRRKLAKRSHHSGVLQLRIKAASLTHWANMPNLNRWGAGSTGWSPQLCSHLCAELMELQ